MSVEKHYYKLLQEQGAMIKALIDPVEQPIEESAKMAKAAEEAGVDVILVGGSIGVGGDLLDRTVLAIKDKVSIPIVMFPGNINGVSKHADATYFMTLINTDSTYWNSEAQILGAPFVHSLKIESIPTAYIVLEPGGAVGWVGKARMVPRSQPKIAAACALAGKLMGARFVLTDSGSGAKSPAPPEIIGAVKKAIGETLYIYGGGIKNEDHVKQVIAAGADCIQIGSAFENSHNPTKYMEKLVKATKEAGKKKL